MLVEYFSASSILGRAPGEGADFILHFQSQARETGS